MMRMRRLAAIGLLAGVWLSALAVGAGADWSARHVVMISIDGMRPQLYGATTDAKLPVIRRLMQRGAWSRGVTGVMPTVTYPSHTTMITGVPPAVHGIYDNRITDPENQSSMGWYWYARDIKVMTLPAAVRARGMTAAAVSWPVTVGMDLDYNVPELLRSRHRDNLELVDALTSPAHLLDAYAQASGAPVPWPMTDDDRGAIAEWILGRYEPTLLLLHLFNSDSMAHEHGPDSPEAIAAVEHADAIVGRLVDRIAAAHLDASTDVVIVSDHGFLPLEKQVNLNAALRAEALLQTDERGAIKGWDAYVHSAGGSGYVFLKRPDDSQLAQRVATLLDKWAADPQFGIDRVWSAADLARAGAHPDASFGVTMKRGAYLGSGTASVITPLGSKGGHGYDASWPELQSSLVMAGPDVPAAGDIGVVSMTRIAPTIARWLGVRLSPEAAEPLVLLGAAP
jgi:predicted AlkP superfamily pyrophosphatase or phosphodiesterase